MLVIQPEDLAPFAEIDNAKARAMINDALALAARAAPCIHEDSFEYPDAALAIIRGAILRWNEAGSGALSSEQQQAGPYNHTVSMDTRQQRRPLFWPSEITDLQKLCNERSGAYSVDTVAHGYQLLHDDVCALNFGAAYCSCGAVLTGNVPLYGSA